MVLISIAISVLILIQEGNTNEITGLNSSTSDTFYGKNKSKSKESTLKKWTVGLAIALLIVSTLFFIFKI
jgi:preprotein translocase subunit SecG